MTEILSARQKLPNLIQSIVQEPLQQKQWGYLSREGYPGCHGFSASERSYSLQMYDNPTKRLESVYLFMKASNDTHNEVKDNATPTR